MKQSKEVEHLSQEISKFVARASSLPIEVFMLILLILPVKIYIEPYPVESFCPDFGQNGQILNRPYAAEINLVHFAKEDC